MKKLKIARPVYLALASLLFMALNDFHIINVTPNKYDTYVTLIALVLTGFGVIANPMVEVPHEEEEEQKSSMNG